MKDEPIQSIGNEKWLSMSEAAPLTPYSAEYLSLLARKKKIASKKIDNTWYTTKEVLDAYMGKQMLRAQVQTGDLHTTLQRLRSYQGDVNKLMAEAAPTPAPTTEHVEKALERVLDKKISENEKARPQAQKVRVVEEPVEPKRSHIKTVLSSRFLVAGALALLVLMTVLPVPIVFSFFDKSLNAVVDAFKDANTVMGFRPGTHENEILLLDKEGNISIMGHIETDGQFRSYVAQGIAPIVVNSTTTVSNLSADLVDGLSTEEFTLAFVTKNGNMTTENVVFDGQMVVGKTLLVKGATKLLSTLEVGSDLKVFGEAEFQQAMTVFGPAYFEALVTMAEDLKVKGNLSVNKNISVRGSIEAGSAIIGKSGSFGTMGVSGNFSAGGKITLGNGDEVITINAENIVFDKDGNATFDGAVSAVSLSGASLSATNSTTTNATSTNFFSTTASSTNLFSTNFTLGAGSIGDVTIETADINNLTLGTATATDGIFTNITFTRATGTSATTTNFFTNVFRSALATITSLIADDITTGALTATDSTLTNITSSSLTASNSTTTNATSTNSFFTTASSTNLYSTSANLGTITGGTGVMGTLLVNGSTTLQNFTFVNATGTSATTTNFYSTTASSTNLYSSLLSVGGSALNVIANGNVGIGTTNPLAKLSVLGAGTTGFEFIPSETTGSSILQTITRSSGTYRQMTFDAANWVFRPSGSASDNVVIDTTGRFGIGTSTPFEKLSIAGNAYIGGNLTATGTVSFLNGLTTLSNLLLTGSTTLQNFTFVNATGTSATTTNFYSTTASSTNLYSSLLTVGGNGLVVDSSRNVGIGTTNPNGNLVLSGASGNPTLKLTSNGVTSQGGMYLQQSNQTVNWFVGANYQNNTAVTDGLEFSEPGGVRMFIETGGNVGIGTTNPAQKLDVLGKFRLANSGDAGAVVLRENPSGSSFQIMNEGESDFYPLQASSYQANDGLVGSPSFSFTNDVNTGLYRGGADILSLVTGGTDRVYIDASGNIGIGTTSPAYKLSVEGSSTLGNQALAGYFTATTTTDSVFPRFTFTAATGTSATTTNFYSTTASSTNLYSTTGSIGNLSLNGGSASAPALWFAGDSTTGIYRDASNVVRVTSAGTRVASFHAGGLQVFGGTGSAAAPNLSIDAAGSTGLFVPAAAMLGFTNGGTETMRITSTGNIGIATTSPFEKLSVAGNAYIGGNLTATGTVSFLDGLTTLSNLLLIGSSTLQNFTFNIATGTSATTTNFFSTTASSTNLFSSLLSVGGSAGLNVVAGGSVGIGTTDPSSKLHVSTTATANGNDVLALFKRLNPAFTGGSAILRIDAADATTADIEVNSASSAAGHRYGSYGDLNIVNNYSSSGLGDINLVTNSLTRLTVENGGNVGIGTTTPGSKLSVTSGLSVGVNYGIAAPNNGLIVQGFTGVGTTTPVEELSVGGEIYLTGGLGVGLVNTTAGSVSATGNIRTSTSLISGSILNCNAASSAVQTDGTGTLTCGAISAIGGTSAGGWTWITPSYVRLATTSDRVIIGSSGSPTEKVEIHSGSAATTTLGLHPAASQTANILSIYNTSGSIASVFTADHKFGIGKTNPLVSLEVDEVAGAAGGAAPQGGIVVSDISSTATVLDMGVDNAGSSYSWLQSRDYNATNYRALSLNPVGGNVGIGTTEPGSKLSFGTDVEEKIRLYDSGTAATSYGFGIATDDLQIFTSAGKKISFRSGGYNGIEKVIFDLNTGNVGIATTTPYAKLSVVGGTTGTIIAADAITGFTGNLLDLKVASTTKFSINQAGDVLLSGSTTLQNFTFNTATGTSATTTNFFSATASSTNLFSSLLSVGGTAGLNVIAGGSVGIGTTNPGYKLEVEGTADFDGALTFGNASVGRLTWASAPDRFAMVGEAGYGLSLGTNGTLDRLFIDTSGNVGIGSTTPWSLLSLQSASNVVGTLNTTNTGGNSMMQFTNSGDAANPWSLGRHHSGYFFVAPSANGANPSSEAFVIDTSGNVGVATGTDATLLGKFSVQNTSSGYTAIFEDSANDSTPFIIDASGNVGIGTTDPQKMLHIQSTTVNPSLRISQGALAGVDIYESQGVGDVYFDNLYDTGTAKTFFRARALGTPVDVMTLTASGNVGIGTTTPNYPLEVQTTANSIATVARLSQNRTAAADTGPGLTFGGGTNGSTDMGYIAQGWNGAATTDAYMQFITRGSNSLTEKMRITSAGNVGIGTTNPDYVLEINGGDSATILSLTTNTYTSGAAGSLMHFGLGATSGNTYSRIQALTTGGAVVGNLALQESGGNVGIGTTVPDGKLHVHTATAGSVTANTSYDDLVIENSDSGGLSVLVPDASFAEMAFGSPTDSVGAILAWKQSTGEFWVGTDHATGYLRFNTGASTEQMRITSSGNVGIGTTAPTSTLQVHAATGNQTTAAITETGSKNGLLSITGLNGSTAGEGGGIIFGGQSANNFFAAIKSLLQSSAGNTIGDLAFSTRNATGDSALTERMRIAYGGNVGIGTTNPQGTLHVAGSGGTALRLDRAGSGYFDAALTGAMSGSALDLTWDAGQASSGHVFYTRNSSNTQVLGLGIDRNGNVGIGTTNVSAALDVNGSVYSRSTTGFMHYSSGERGGLMFGNAGTPGSDAGNVMLTSEGNQDLYFSTDKSTARMIIQGSTGYVGIGSSTPFAMLGIENTGSGLSFAVNDVVNDSRPFVVDASGNVGIGTTGPLSKLHLIQEGTGGGGGPGNGTTPTMGLVIGDYGTNGALNLGIDATGTFHSWIQSRDKASATYYNLTLNPYGGNVGIATTSPFEKLSVAGNAYIGGNLTATGTLSVANLLLTGSTTLQNFTFNIATGTSATTTNFYSTTASSTNLFSSLLSVGGTAGLNVIAGGNVGIGTTNPGNLLSLNGTTPTLQISDSVDGTVGFIGNANDLVTGTAGRMAIRAENGLYLSGGGNSQHVFVNTSGNVGIGTTDPSTYLNVRGASTDTVNFHDTTAIAANVGAGLYLGGNYTGTTVTTWAALRSGKDNATDGNYAGYLSLWTRANGAAHAEVMRLTSAGLVGIGTTTPDNKLSIGGGDDTSLTITRNTLRTVMLGDSGSNNGGDLLLYDSSGTLNTTIRGGATTTFSTLGLTVGTSQFVVQQTSGKVGIGTAAPGTLLDLYSTSGGNMLRMNGSGANTQYVTYNNTGGTSYLGVEGSGGGSLTTGSTAYALVMTPATSRKLQFGYNGGSGVAMTVDTTGNVGIGTTTPAFPLSVQSNSGANAIQIIGRNNGTTDEGTLAFMDNDGLTKAYIQSVGNNLTIIPNSNVGIGTSAPGSLLHVYKSSTSSLLEDGIRVSRPGVVGSYAYMSYANGSDTAYFGSVYSGGAKGQITLQVSDGSSSINALHVNAVGNVGIGSTTPYAKLSVAGGTTGTLIVADAASGFSGNLLDLKVASTTKFSVNQAGDLLASGSTTLQNFTFNTATGTSATTTNFFSATASSTNLFSSLLSVGGTAGLNVIAGGSVGIGIATPGVKLDVNGSIRANDGTAEIGLGSISGVRRIQGYASGPTVRLLDTGNNYGSFGVGALSVGGTYAEVSAPTNGLLVEGNVGIGTTTPMSMLSIRGTRGTSNAGQLLVVGEADHGYIQVMSTSPTTRDAGIQFIGLGSIANPNWAIKTLANSSDLRFTDADADVTAMTLQNTTGNVGIGTTNPGVKLDVRDNSVDSIAWGSTSAAIGTLTYSGTTARILGPAGDVTISPNGTTDPFIVKATSGNVGIGTTTPQARLEIDGTTAGNPGVFLFSDGGTYTPMQRMYKWTGAGSNYHAWRTQVDSSGYYKLGYAAATAVGTDGTVSERLTIDTSGNVGIGTSTPGALFDVYAGASGGGYGTNTKMAIQSNGNAFLQFSTPNTSISGLYFGDPQQSTQGGVFYDHAADYLRFDAGAANKMVINSSGNVGIGTTTPNNLLTLYSATTPSLEFSAASGSTNKWTMGIDTADGNKFKIASSTAVGTNPRLTINGSGNVGIGTTDPGAKLEVNGTTMLDSGLLVKGIYSVNSVAKFGDGTASTYNDVDLNGASTANYGARLSFQSAGTEYAILAREGRIVGGTSNNLLIRTTGATDLKLGTNGADNLTIQSGGNVGIGTTTPNNVLDVYSATKSAIGFSGASGSTYKWTMGMDVSSGGRFSIASSTALGTTDRFVIDGSGNVGIGTTTPSAKLSVATAGATTAMTVQSAQGSTAGALAFGSLNSSGRIQALANDSIATAGTANLILNDSGGNVAIGTTTAASRLVVHGVTRLVPLTSGANALLITDAGFTRSLQFTDQTIGGAAGYSMYSNTAVPIDFGTNSASRMLIDGTGNVGIGLTNPSTKLHVSGTSATAEARITSTTGNTLGTLSFYENANAAWTLSGTGANGRLDIKDAWNSANVMSFTANNGVGQVSIGTTTAASRLYVLSAGNDGMRLARAQDANTSGTYLSFFGGSNAATARGYLGFARNGSAGSASVFNGEVDNYMGFRSETGIHLGTNGDNIRMTIDTSGNVGIGTTTPSSKLQIGSILSGGAVASPEAISLGANFSNSAGANLKLKLYEVAGSSNTFGLGISSNQLDYVVPSGSSHAFYVGATKEVTIDANGLGIGTAPSTALHVAGTIRQTAAINCALATNASGDILCTSDENLKDLMGTYTSALDVVNGINPIKFRFKNEEYVHVGFSAQNVQTVLPEATPIQGDGTLGLDSNAILAASINAIKALNSRTLGVYSATTTPQVFISEAGNVGVGTSTPEYKLHVAGDVAGTSFVNISTREAKKNIEYVTDEEKGSFLDSLLGIKVATYRYKEENENAPERLGLIAEEAPAEVLSANGRGVDIYKLATYTLAVVQELYTELTEIKNTVLAFADRLVSRELVALEKLCIGSTCINENQLIGLLQNAGMTASAMSTSTTTTSTTNTTTDTNGGNGNEGEVTGETATTTPESTSTSTPSTPSEPADSSTSPASDGASQPEPAPEPAPETVAETESAPAEITTESAPDSSTSSEPAAEVSTAEPAPEPAPEG